MHEAIVVKYLGPTYTKPSRLKATWGKDSLTISFPYEIPGERRKRFAAEKLLEKLDVLADLVEGSLGSNSVFVLLNKR